MLGPGGGILGDRVPAALLQDLGRIDRREEGVDILLDLRRYLEAVHLRLAADRRPEERHDLEIGDGQLVTEDKLALEEGLAPLGGGGIVR